MIRVFLLDAILPLALDKPLIFDVGCEFPSVYSSPITSLFVT